jgi:hypothetical protein
MISGIPGIVCQLPNSHVETLLGPDWSQLLVSIGKGADVIMADLLLECAIFVPTDEGGSSGRDNYYQLSGMIKNLLNRAIFLLRHRFTSVNDC